MEKQDENLETEEFDLEDILREFGGGDWESEQEEESSDPTQVISDDVQQSVEEIPAAEEDAKSGEKESEACKDETENESVWIPETETSQPEISEAENAEQETVLEERLNAPTISIPVEEIQKAENEQHEKTDPEDEMASEPEQSGSADGEQETVEPFSDAWEPEYEEPMGEYVPPQPIVFQPRSQVRELKRKLVAGPEKRYYALSELGVGKLQAMIFLNLLVVLLSVGATVMYAMGMVQPNRLRLMVFGQFFAMMLSALLGSYQLIEGVTDLFHKRFTLNTMLTVTFLACCADGVLGLQELRVPCCAAFSLEMTMSLWNAFEKRNTELGQMDTLRKATRLNSVVEVPDYYKGMKGLLRDEGRVEDFMDNYNGPSKPEKVLNTYALIAMLICVGCGILGGVLHGVSFGIQVFAVSMLAAVPAASFVAVSRPMAVLERKLHKLGAVICGWQGVQNLSGKAAFPLNHEDLFPNGATTLNGVKFYSDRDPDQTVAYAAALIAANGGGLTPLFAQLLEGRNGRHYDVENLRCYGEGGVGGEIGGEPVLVGILPFMREMGVEIPEGTRVNQAVYAAVDGELCGLFAISYEKERSSAAGISALCSSKDLSPVLVSGDFMLTASFIRGRFGANTRKVEYPDHKERAVLTAVEPEQGSTALAMVTQEGLAPVACAVAGARAYRSAAMIGIAIQMLGGILGMAMMLILAIVGAANLLTPSNMLLYQLTWILPGLLVTEWTRSV